MVYFISFIPSKLRESSFLGKFQSNVFSHLPSLATTACTWKECMFRNALIAMTACVVTHSCPPFEHLLSERLTSLGIMGEPRVPPLNPSETIVLSEHHRL